MLASNIAIIFQCAALFVPTLAIYKLSHANEIDKKFMCYNKIINVHQYWEEKLEAD
ncbi:BgtE-10118 [Blumeria graminis f. sp. tritici]|uniref:BgtE-10118 n=2 Tax=Blumeria graminis f. sp. tritici TaxID=62690 RepID=A0A9X9MH86_BLUGR|nr:putative secreted effector protein [Blumeria graminis f. sp. tritici 96224]VDB88018.1 BgtE-10118 [Blumeria graminis f. sp. tritici]